MRTAFFVACGVVLCLAAGAVWAAETTAPAPPPPGPPSVEVHGYVQTRYYLDTVETADRDLLTGEIFNKDETSQLVWERISLSGLARLPEKRVLYGEVYIHPWLPRNNPAFLYLESLYLDLPQAQPNDKLRVGKGRDQCFGIVPAYGNRKFSNYSPVEETFTMDRVLGIQSLNSRGTDSLNFAILNSYRPGVRYIGQAGFLQLENAPVVEDGVLSGFVNTLVPHLSNRDVPQDRSRQLQFDARYGHQMGPLNVGVSGRVGRLDPDDLRLLRGPVPDPAIARSPIFTDAANVAQIHGRSREQWGVDATYNRAPFYATLQYYGGETANIGQTGLEVVAGIEPSAKCPQPWSNYGSFAKGLYVRYSKLTNDLTPIPSNANSWDISQWAVSYVFPFPWQRPSIWPRWIQVEYEWNQEDNPPGVSEIPNNVFFVELFTAW